MDSLKTKISVYRTLNGLYRNKTSSFTAVKANIKPMTTFAKVNNKSGPLVIQGRLITAGKYTDSSLGEFNLEPQELHKAMLKWKGVRIYTSHRVFEDILTGQNPSIKEVLGQIKEVSWNAEDDGIDFVGEISDDDVSKKILQGLIKYVSVGFARDVLSEKNDNEEFEHFLRNIEPGEASLVFNPRDPMAEFTPVL